MFQCVSTPTIYMRSSAWCPAQLIIMKKRETAVVPLAHALHAIVRVAPVSVHLKTSASPVLPTPPLMREHATNMSTPGR